MDARYGTGTIKNVCNAHSIGFSQMEFVLLLIIYVKLMMQQEYAQNVTKDIWSKMENALSVNSIDLKI